MHSVWKGKSEEGAVLPHRTDGQLLEDMRHGGADALGVLFDRYGRLVLTVARRILRDDGEAEEVMQEVFLEVYRKAFLYHPERGSARVWLLQYAYHRSFNRRKYLALRGFYDLSPAAELADLDLARSHSQHNFGMNEREWKLALTRGLDEIGRKERDMIRNVALNGASVKEAAESIGESYVNGRNLYYRGLKKLRQLLTTGKEVSDVRS